MSPLWPDRASKIAPPGAVSSDAVPPNAAVEDFLFSAEEQDIVASAHLDVMVNNAANGATRNADDRIKGEADLPRDHEACPLCDALPVELAAPGNSRGSDVDRREHDRHERTGPDEGIPLDENILAAMLPPLPSPDDPVMPCARSEQDSDHESGGSFEDRVLLLLAAVTAADGILTYPEYELAGSVIRRIFGDRALQAGMQARFHSALLHPPAHPEDLAASLAQEAVAEKVSGEQVDALLAGLEELSRRYHTDDVARRLREAIDIAFAEERLEHRRRRLEKESGLGHSLEQGARLGVQMGRVAVGGTLQLMHSVVDRAWRALPGHGGAVMPAEENLTPPVAAFNEATAALVDSLAGSAWTLGEKALRREFLEFRSTLADQPFRVVLVGEGKRGKSSLANALLGEELSPVRESIPETATVAEFSYASLPRYSVRFFDEAHFENLEAYLAGEEDNLLLRGKVESLREKRREGEFPRELSRGLAPLTSRADIPDYLAVDGRYSAFVARVGIGLPVEILRQGMVLVDTPGLNSTDSFQDYLAYEESLTADCLIFVLDARRPDSASELRLLRKLAAAGRALSIIGVLTGVDRLNEADSLSQAKDRALTILSEACRGTANLRVLGLVAFDAREAMRARCYPGEKISRQTGQELEILFNLVRSAMASDTDRDGYRVRVAELARGLAEKAGVLFQTALDRYRASLPPAQFLELLERHADRLAEAAVSHADQARSVVLAAAHDVERWRTEQNRALDAWEELLVLRVMEAAHRHADVLGNDFARDDVWKSFDEDEAPGIARQSLNEFLAAQQEILYGWNEKLRFFQSDLRELSVLCLKEVEESADELGNICATTGRMDHLLIQTNTHMRNLAVFLAGAGAGTVLTGSLFHLVALGGAALVVLTHPLTLPGVALVGMAAYALHSMGNAERRKAAFLERKKKKTALWAKEARRRLETELDAARDELTAAYKSVVARGFVPALEILVEEAVHLRLYLKVMDRIREDVDGFERVVEGQLEALEQPSD